MHSVIRIRHFVVKILILVSNTMMIVILHIVENGHVVMDVASSVDILRKEVESNIVPVRWLDLICWGLFMSKVIWKRQGSGSGIKESHFSLEELVLTSVVESIFVSHTKSSCEHS
jgi:hypothetical protein